jgi:hypothetical protein
VDGGWQKLTSTLLTGVCRTAFPWRDNAGILNVGFGTHSALQVWQSGGLYTITPLGPPVRLAANALAVTNGVATVTVTETAHGRSTADNVKIYGATAIGGITPNMATVAITKINANSWSYTFTSNATSTVAAGGGTNIVVTSLATLPAGAVDGTGTVGYGTGGYGAGPYGQTPATLDYFPRTWSFGAWGENLLASPRNGGLYQWSNSTGRSPSL